MSRVRARIEGTVQGVGFRPYVYRLADEMGLAGHVLNDSRGVVVEVEAPAEKVERFLARLPVEAPPLATVERVIAEQLEELGEEGFSIRESPAGGEPRAAVTPDSATCDDCLQELFDPGDRRFRYPFTNCTNCGPRFTIVRDVPYDRPNTTMAGFAMCGACRAEYEDPADRRFHAQPNACPECGPAVRLAYPGGGDFLDPHARDAIEAAARALRDGAIVAIKGIGGFHLACLARDEDAVAELRGRKHREDKPFALMAANLGGARELVFMGAAEETLLLGRARPIVLAPRRCAVTRLSRTAPSNAVQSTPECCQKRRSSPSTIAAVSAGETASSEVAWKPSALNRRSAAAIRSLRVCAWRSARVGALRIPIVSTYRWYLSTVP